MYCPIVSVSYDNSVESLKKATKLPIIWAAGYTLSFQRARRTQSRTVRRYTATFHNASSKNKTSVLLNTILFFVKSYLEMFTKVM